MIILKVLIIGNFEGGNKGDDLVLDSLITMIKKYNQNMNEFIIPGLSTEHLLYIKKICSNAKIIIPSTSRRHFALRFLSLKTIYYSFKANIIITSAGILFDRKLFNPRYSFICTLYPILLLAKTFNKKCKVLGVCVDVITTEKGFKKKVLQNTIKLHDEIILRNPNVVNFFDEINYKHYKVAADCVFGLKKPEIKKRSSNTIALNITETLVVSNAKKRNEFLYALNNYIKKNMEKYNFVFFSTNKNDTEFIKRYIKSLDFKNNGVEFEIFDATEHSFEEINVFLSQLSLLIGMRMHSLILSLLNVIPIIGIVYDKKVSGLMMQCKLENFCFEFNELNYENLDLSINEIIKNSESIKNHIYETVNKKYIKVNCEVKKIFENL
ncbi:polysaccharide pyruvyl transferase family protein [Sporolactobacillus terrae]|uniref:polysaccharide pyruvyl transferase family protein n=1 Tax=Sporolactobacillus terrae TaxID=269673 RepID=UPI001261189B|nr:polysaccharide pyruvyl transferase family protein [Sporolactobacillus terrae]